MPATKFPMIRNDDEYEVVACCIAARNNEMIDLIAKYFFRFLHELTVSSFLVTFVLASRNPRSLGFDKASFITIGQSKDNRRTW